MILNIRRVREEEIPKVARLISEAWRVAYPDIFPPALLEELATPERREADLRAALAVGTMVLVAEGEGGRILGTVSDRVPARRAEGEVDVLYVDPNLLGGGIGRALLVALAQDFWHRGYRTMSVHTLHLNVKARRFYERLGARFVGSDEWQGLVAVWYAWDENSLRNLIGEPDDAELLL